MSSTPRPEWLRPKEISKYFGIGRSKSYELIASGKVKSVSLRKRGQKYGTRLVSYDSLAAYLESLAEGGDGIPVSRRRSDTEEGGI
jgi:excisionase family DNA binding protein